MQGECSGWISFYALILLCDFEWSSKAVNSIDQVGSDSFQGAGAPTMFQAMRCIIDSLADKYVGESAFERAIRKSFLGTFCFYHYELVLHCPIYYFVLVDYISNYIHIMQIYADVEFKEIFLSFRLAQRPACPCRCVCLYVGVCVYVINVKDSAWQKEKAIWWWLLLIAKGSERQWTFVMKWLNHKALFYPLF